MIFFSLQHFFLNFHISHSSCVRLFFSLSMVHIPCLRPTVNPRVLFSFKENGLGDQSPDGMTIDADGNLWIACFGGGQVGRVKIITCYCLLLPS